MTPTTGPTGTKLSDTPRVTRDVEPLAVRDLLDHPPRATLAFVGEEGIDLLPVTARFSEGIHRFGVSPDAGIDFQGREVVLLIDDGEYWFDLRGISVRGTAVHLEPAPSERLVWYTIEPRRILAWDYGTVREE